MSLLPQGDWSTLKMLSYNSLFMSKELWPFQLLHSMAGCVKSPVSHKASSIDSWNGQAVFPKFSLSAYAPVDVADYSKKRKVFWALRLMLAGY